eukprot:scaffold414750_cov31-Attheya_sp.AAC.1
MAAKYGKEALESHGRNQGRNNDPTDERDNSISDRSAVTVTSVEMASAMARLARLTVASNHLQD